MLRIEIRRKTKSLSLSIDVPGLDSERYEHATACFLDCIEINKNNKKRINNLKIKYEHLSLKKSLIKKRKNRK